MQRVWTVVLSVWAMLAVVAGLAWSYRPTLSASSATAQTVLVRTANGKNQLLTLAQSAPATTPHATTSTSVVVP